MKSDEVDCIDESLRRSGITLHASLVDFTSHPVSALSSCCLFTVSELCPDAALHENGLHGLLRLPLGHLPVLLTAERWRHGRRGSGLHHGPSQDPGGDAAGPTGPEEAKDPEGKLKTAWGGRRGGRGGCCLSLRPWSFSHRTVWFLLFANRHPQTEKPQRAEEKPIITVVMISEGWSLQCVDVFFLLNILIIFEHLGVNCTLVEG